MRKTTKQRLHKNVRSAPLALTSSAESFNATSKLSQQDNLAGCSKPLLHSGSGYDSRKGSRMSAHSVFVLGKDGRPLTPTKPSKAYKLLKAKQAVPAWSKFGQFGIQMVVETRRETPKTVLGVDLGTKFEGYSVVCGKENNLSVMWKLPDKKKLVKKLEERSDLRRARRFRNCRRRPAKFDNRGKKGFLAPSQRVMVQSRLKCMAEFFKYYPITSTVLEDVKFNHRDNKRGKNFSTIEIGKTAIKNYLRECGDLFQCSGYDTQDFRAQYGYQKSSSKSAEVFNAHCSDALALAVHVHAKKHVMPGHFLVVDDTYRPVRRRLHDTQPAKKGIRDKYSTGNFKGIRKGTICEHGRIVGGTKNSFWIRNAENKRIGRTKVFWLSHHFKTNGGAQFLPTLSDGVSLRTQR